jgi:GntR family transcriptional regulator, transcriptional repressor for pyruvate dehydrogenase complex
MTLTKFSVVSSHRRSRPKDVFLLFKAMIRDGQCRPGERLPNERDLAHHLGVSRPSLREAIGALAAMNILEVRHGDGTYVTSLEPELLAEPLQLILAIDDSAIFSLFEMRRLIEPAAAGLAAERATAQERDLLRRELERGMACQSQPAVLIEHDTALHRLVHRAAHNALLVSVSASLSGLARRARLRTVQLPENARLTMEEHRAFVEAICEGQPTAATAAMLKHLQRIERQLRADHMGSTRAGRIGSRSHTRRPTV